MSIDGKPLFRPEAVRPKVRAFTLPPHADQGKIAKWAKMFATKSKVKLKETEVRDEFLYDIFRDVLGYVTVSDNPAAYTFKKEQFVQADGTYADAGFGRFGTAPETPLVVLEGKGPNDPLDRPYAGRKRSAFEQALYYALNLKIDWYLVTNLRETRLYCKQADQFTFERFETQKLATDEFEWKRFVYLLGAERVIAPAGNHLAALLVESAKIGRELTNEFYREYRQLRELTFQALRHENPARDPSALLTATQKILDRVLFIAFCEDRGLLPRDIITRAYQNSDPFNPKPIWENFTGLFKSVDQGNKALEIWQYNGGLFAEDDFLDSLIVPDAVCLGFKKLADYEYGNAADTEAKLIDVEILGHVFEQSISDLEEIQNVIAGKVPELKLKEQKRNSRKEAGAFYTPAFITRYIVRETLIPVLEARLEKLRKQHQSKLGKKGKEVLETPKVFDAEELTDAAKKVLVAFWEKWVEELATIRIVDPACGSGAFLLEAFDQLFQQYTQAQSFLTALRGLTLFDIRKTILESNLYGVDLNGEAVEIARLSCWIKTAEFGKVLTSLDHNIIIGNSVVSDPAVHPKALDWHAAFPKVFAAGGFDVVIGNPPYVRQEWIKEYKSHWEKEFQSYASTADLFVYFYELGMKLLRSGGRVGYITSGGWVRGAYGEGLRGFLANNAGLESMIDFGEFQPFEDAEMIRPTILIASKREPGGPMKLWKWLTSGRPPETLSDEIRKAPSMRTDHLGSATWELETDEVIALKNKLASGGTKLGTLFPEMYTGIKTGLDSAFIISKEQGEELVSKDARNAEVVKRFIQGTNIRSWYSEFPTQSILFVRRGTDLLKYPLIQNHLEQFRAELEPRNLQEDGVVSDTGRKPGTYKWYEIQDTVGFWEVFEDRMIVWPDITNYPRFAFLEAGTYVGMTAFVIPSSNAYLLGVLSSWATWFFISKSAQPLRLRSGRWQYRLKGQYMENVPIPDAPPAERDAIATLAERCNTLGTQRYRIEEQVRHRLLTSFRTDPQAKLNEKAQAWWALDFIALGESLKTSFKRKQNPFTSPKTADEWEPYIREKFQEVDTLRRHLTAAEAEINDRVYQLFNLTPDEIKLLQREVKH